MESITNKLKPIVLFGGWIVSAVLFLWGVFGFYYGTKDELKLIQKMTLRNTIWNENIPMGDRLESCDHYLELGFNSQTKKYCNNLLEREGDY